MSTELTAEVAIEAANDWPMAVARVTIPPGGEVGVHDHSCSAALLLPVTSKVTLFDELDRRLELDPGSMVRIPVDHQVRIFNFGDQITLLIMVFDLNDDQQFTTWPPAPATRTNDQMKMKGG